VTSSSTLQRLAKQASQASAAALEQCELCSARIPAGHRHLLDVPARNVRCVCYPCSVLFDREAASEGRFKLIPDRHLFLPDFDLSDEQWQGLRVPVGIAFVVHDAHANQPLAFYPSPMGPTQALLDPQVWQEVIDHNPILGSLQPDVEALLVNRVRGARAHYLVPIDDCYRLVGLIRTNWRGLTGGKDVWQHVDAFFGDVQARSKTLQGKHP
jgi:Family of unknown function (DUF5947)